MVAKGFISPLGILMRYWIFLCHFWKKQNWAVFVVFFFSKCQSTNLWMCSHTSCCLILNNVHRRQ